MSLPVRPAEVPNFSAPVGANPTLPFMLVRVGGRWFALAAHSVQEVASKGAVTRVPTAARHVLGVTGLRGGLLPVISLEQMLGTVGPAAPESTTMRPRLVVVRAGECEIAVVVDEVRGIVDDFPGAATAAVSSESRPSFLRQEFDWQGKRVCELDVPQLVTTAAASTPEGA
jgi:chemotaxis-related protein WspD